MNPPRLATIVLVNLSCKTLMAKKVNHKLSHKQNVSTITQHPSFIPLCHRGIQRSWFANTDSTGIDDRNIWRNRSVFQDLTQTWLNRFVDYASKAEQIKPEDLCLIAEKETARELYNEVKVRQRAEMDRAQNQQRAYRELDAVRKEVKSMTIWGIIKYGFQLSIVEVSTLCSIFVFKLIIDFLKTPEAFTTTYSIGLFAAFACLRLITIMARSFYDLHVYNYFRFVQTKVQCWLFELTCTMRQY